MVHFVYLSEILMADAYIYEELESNIVCLIGLFSHERLDTQVQTHTVTHQYPHQRDFYKTCIYACMHANLYTNIRIMSHVLLIIYDWLIIRIHHQEQKQ